MSWGSPVCFGLQRGSIVWLALTLMSGAIPAAEPMEVQGKPRATVYATATVRERPLDTATAAVTILDRAAIEATGAETVADLLRFVPGVDLASQGTRGGLATAQIRGGGPNFTLVLLDGVALNDGTYQVGEVFNLEGLPTPAIERIEIVRGPTSSRYGSAGLAGAIHIVTRQGTADGDTGFEVEASVGDARHGRARVALSGGGARGRYFIDVSGQREEARVADERFAQLHLQGRGSVLLGARAQLELVGRFTNWEGDDYPEASGGPTLGSGALRRADNREASFGVVLRMGRNERRRHRVGVSVYRHGLGRESPAIAHVVPPSIEDTVFTRSRVEWSATLDPRPGVQVSVGADAVREIGENTSTLVLPDFLGGAIAGDYRLSRTTPAVFTEVLMHRGDWIVELGARLDWTEQGGTEASPRVGLRVRPGGGSTQIRASLGRAFKLPSFFALASPRALGGNPALQPEEMIGADLGVERSFADGALDIGVTVFANRYENLVDFDFATFLHVNRAEVTAQGVESSLRWQPHPAWHLAANATWQRVEKADSGETLRHRPDWISGLRVGWRPRSGIGVHLDGQWVSSFRDEQIPVPERLRVAAHLLVGTTVDWRFTSRLRLRARIDNLLDKPYEARIGFPGAGRSFRLSLRWSGADDG